jgi:hypothetical protein
VRGNSPAASRGGYNKLSFGRYRSASYVSSQRDYPLRTRSEGPKAPMRAEVRPSIPKRGAEAPMRANAK